MKHLPRFFVPHIVQLIFLPLAVLGAAIVEVNVASAATVADVSPTAVTVTGSSWNNPTNILTSDNQRATGKSTTQDELRITGFDFSSIPNGAQIDGITVKVEGQHSSGGDAWREYRLNVTKDGTSAAGTWKTNIQWLQDTDSIVASGSASDLWGTTWTTNEIKGNSNFGIIFSDTNTTQTSTNPGWGVDHITVTVDYTSTCSDSDPSTITIPAGQTASGDPFDARSMFSTTGDVGSFEYKVTNGSGSGTVELLDNSGANWNTHTENDPAPTSHSYTAPAGGDRIVVAVISGEGTNPTITGVTIGGSTATLIDTVTNGNSTIWAYYRPIGSSISTTSANIAVNWGNDPDTGAAVNAATYSGAIQTTGTGTGFTINSVATGSASSGTTTTSSTVTNVAGGRVIYAINMNRGDGNNQIATATSAAWTFGETWDVYVLSNRTAAGHSDTAAGTATVSAAPAGGSENHNRSTMVVFALNPAAAQTVCTDWTGASDIPASIGNGSTCDFTDGGIYTLDVRGIDPDCSDAVTTTSASFTWNACPDPDPSTITIPGSQTASGDPFDASSMFSSTGDVGSFEYKVTSGSGTGTVDLLDNSGLNWSVHTEGSTAPTSHSYTAPAGDDRVVVAVISGEGSAPTITGVTIGGSTATLIDTITNGNSTIWVYYRPIGSSASATSENIAVTYGNAPSTDAAINAATYSGVLQNTGTGTSYTVNSAATGSASSGTTTTSSSVTNVTGGRVVYAINMNRGNGNNQIATATSSAWTFSETWDIYVTSNRTAAGHSDTTGGTATVSVAPAAGSENHNRSTMVAFALNPAAAETVCTDWTSTSDISASIGNGSNCDFADGGTYTLDVRGTDPDCSGAVTTTPTGFTWNDVYTPLASYTMEQASWTGTVGEVIDSRGNFHGTAIGPANLPITTNTDPAIAGDPGTCAYGEFDDSDDYIEVPGFPNLTSDFTITAWIRTRTNTSAGQRIFADDENNSGGYALSLGDPGTGRLRFYSRGVSPVSMDTGNIIANDTWYFVAGVADTVKSTRTIYIYNASFTQLAVVTGSYTGSWGNDAGMASIGGETNAGEIANRFDGNLDEVRIYAQAISQTGIEQIMRETHSCPVLADVDHYEIHHDGIGLTCQPEDITVYACENAACSSQYAGSADVTLTPTGWAGGDTKSFTGSNTFQLRNTSVGTVTLGISSPNPNASVNCFQNGSPASCNMTFYDSGFIFDVPTQTACKTSTDVTIAAVRLDATSQQCIPAFANRTADINFWSTYANPATGTENISVNGTSVAASSPGTTVSLAFDASGESTFTVQYDDAGELQLDASFTGSGAEAGLSMAGSDTYISVPAGLCVYSDDAGSDCSSGNGLCTAFTQAGQNFNLKVKGVCWEIDGEADTDFCNNTTTPNFQLNNISITHSLVAPGTGVPGSIAVSTFDMAAGENGDHTINNQSVSEVGVFTFTADPPAYLSVGDIIPTSTSANIGRFIPDHFSLSINPDPPAFANSCAVGNFTYLGDSFSFAMNPQITIVAENTANNTTENYEDGFWKLGEPFTLHYTYADTGASVALSPASSSSSPGAGATTNCGGSLSITLSDSFMYARPTASSPVSPFAASIDFGITQAELTDTDSVCYDIGSGCQAYAKSGMAGVSLRHGQLKVYNNFGPETEDITNSPFGAQYYDGSNWVVNANDACTTGISFCPAARIGSILPAPLAIGTGVMTITTSGTLGETVTVCPVGPSWLTGLSTCATPDGFCGDITFGIFRGNDRIINWQEIVR